ncbi:MMPL family transporter [Lactobacillus gasseri]|uniref:MMPL family transporter n=1 Tax=Lactobacillus gasseri TaxID=1596 RepID=UPI003FA5FF84
MKLLKNHLGALVAWIAILLIAIFSLPDVDALTRQHSEISLPEDVQSSIATNIESKWGHGQDNTYVVGVVFNKKHGKLTSSDKEKIDNTIRFLKDNKKKLGIKSMMTPNDNYAAKAQLISKDKTTEIVQLNIANDHSTVSNVNKALTKAVKTSGIRTYVTGVRILEDDFSASVQEGIKKTELITIFFIFIVLVIVFKSPIVPIISLLTVGVSFITSFSIVTNLVEKFNFPFSNFTQVFMVIVLFGIGTDYNILLYDKFKENLSKGMSNHDATNDALRKAGKTILYSGSSILIGFSALGLAKFSIYQSAVGVAVGVAVLLVVLLTLNPFFMAVLGKKLFWPVKNFEGESNSKLWHALSKGSLTHPIIYLVVMAVVVLPFCLFYSNNLNYNDADEISDSTPSKAGLLLLQDHFSEGTPEYSTLYIQSGHKLDNEKSLKEIDQLVKKIQADPDVKFASSVTEPNGKSIKRLYVDNQLGTVNSGVNTARNGLGTLSNGSKQITNGAVQLQNGANQLSNGTGRLQSGANQLQAGAGRLQTGASQLANGAGQIASNNPKITAGIDKVNSGLGEGQEYLTGLADSAAGKTFYIPAKMIHSSTFKPALDNYMSSDLKSTKIIIILKLDPASTEGAKKAHELSNMVKKSVKGTSLQSSTIAMGGQSEKIYDTQETASSDFLRTAIIMLVGIGIALIFVTRSVLQPLFILGTLVIAYLTSLSINQWLVHALLGRSLLAWNTPFFSFIMIVALGVDYSIFLMMRYRELGEVNPGWTTSEKMLQACDIIGTVVISAAIILGGTFAALIPSGVPTLIEVALCVDIGLLLLVFLLPINMSAAMKITYEGLGRKKNKKDTD